MSRAAAVIGAPSAIGISPYRDGGARRLDLAPGVLREHGLVRRLNACDLGDVRPPARYLDLERPRGRGGNEEDVAAYSRKLADWIAAAHEDGQFVVLVGGDCSILLGALLGLHQAGSQAVGLAYVDAHADFATLEESPSGSACSMSLALAVGRAGGPLAHLAGEKPLLRAEHLAHVGRRDHGEPEYGCNALADWGVLDLDGPTIEASGMAAAAAAALERVTTCDAGFWIHFDVDVLDPSLVPAVDSPLPGGLDLSQAAELLAVLAQHPAALGLQVSIYDPALDPGRLAAPKIVRTLEQAFAAWSDSATVNTNMSKLADVESGTGW
jgi:arginase